MANLAHIMPNPSVVPILWGHDYVANPATAKAVEQMVSDLVTGPFMNAMAQYGISRASARSSRTSPPKLSATCSAQPGHETCPRLRTTRHRHQRRLTARPGTPRVLRSR